MLLDRDLVALTVIRRPNLKVNPSTLLYYPFIILCVLALYQHLYCNGSIVNLNGVRYALGANFVNHPHDPKGGLSMGFKHLMLP